MRLVLGLLVAFLAVFLLFADETPASLLSRLNVLLNGTDYATTVFRDQVSMGRVLASEYRTGGDPLRPVCRVAVVELASDAPVKPPRVTVIDQEDIQFGGNWRQTPHESGSLPMPALLALCGSHIDRITLSNLERALAEPGSFVIATGGT